MASMAWACIWAPLRACRTPRPAPSVRRTSAARRAAAPGRPKERAQRRAEARGRGGKGEGEGRKGGRGGQKPGPGLEGVSVDRCGPGGDGGFGRYRRAGREPAYLGDGAQCALALADSLDE